MILERDFDAEQIVRNIERDQTQIILIVGDAMGLPLVEQMEKLSGEVDMSSLFSIASGGAIWSQHVRDRMLAAKEGLLLRDNFGASGRATTVRSALTRTATSKCRRPTG